MLGLPPGVTACLFDLDGVLTDTASVHQAAWKQVFEEHTGRPFTAEDYQEYVDGKPREDGVRDYLASLGPKPDEATVTKVADRKNDLVQDRIARDGVTVFEGSRRYLEACRDAGIRRAVVSSSANTELVLKVTGLAALVEERVDGVTAKERHLPGKPAPDTFLAGAAALGLTARDCAVFEDALAGVEAGRAGDFGHVVGVDRVGHADDLRRHGADVVVQDLAELLP
ncbi:MAG: beta-phosphoglucomutase family hydrolase [Frankiales bacterium]|nr:beta-phosphoglucomutase family hydrolase [Frankiales bacterium]